MGHIAALRRFAALKQETSEPAEDISPEEEIVQTASDIMKDRLARQG